jgi:TRAP-type C4-dicarboxylate transport system permease small subunit
MQSDDHEREEPDEHAEQRDDAERPAEQSIFGPTESAFADPAFNKGVPDDPLVLRYLSKVELAIGVVLFTLIVIGVMYQVIGRYFPSIGWVGSGEVALMSMIALTFTMAGYLVGRNGHIVIEVFDKVLAGTKWFVALRVVSAAIMTLTCLALAYEAFVKIETEWGRASAAMHLPIGALYIFALLGFLSAAINSAWKIPYANRPERQLDISEMEG